MKITKNDGQQLVVSDFPFFGLFFIGFGLVGVYYNYHLWRQPRPLVKDEIFVGLITVIFLAVGVLFTQRSVFIFDRLSRQVQWSRVGLFGRKSGSLSFNDITGCDVQVSSGGSNSGPTYRVALILNNDELPLTSVYTGGVGPRCNQVRDAIIQTVGLPELRSGQADHNILRALLKSGSKIEAIALVREQRRCSLAEAKDYVEDFQQKLGSE